MAAGPAKMLGAMAANHQILGHTAKVQRASAATPHQGGATISSSQTLALVAAAANVDEVEIRIGAEVHEVGR